MGNLIFIIILFVVIGRIAEQSKKSVSGRTAGQKKAENMSGQAGFPEKAAPAPAVRMMGAEKKGMAERSNVRTGEDSTTDYLRQKALEDEREHVEEARREALRLQRESGGKMPALRYMDGDSVPQGMRIVRCSYCGAQNLVPGEGKQKEYTCYFCRETL